MDKKPTNELLRRGQLKTLDAAAGAWKDGDHPELREGSVKWVNTLRRENECRLRRCAIDKGIAKSERQYSQGRSLGPFADHSEFLAVLHRQSAKTGTRKSEQPSR